MKRYTKNMQSDDSVPKVSAESRTPRVEHSFFRVIFLLGCICMIFFCAIALRVFLTARIERMNKQVSRINAQIREYEFQCYHLRNKKASLTSLDYISSKVRQYSLKLRPADYRQIRNVALLPEGGNTRAYSKSYASTPSSGEKPADAQYARRAPDRTALQNRR